MDLIQEVMNWQLHWEYKDHRRALQRTWREDLLKGEATRPNSRYCSNYPKNLLVPLSFLWFVPLAVRPCPWLFLIGLHKSSFLHLRKDSILPFQLGLALSYTVKAPQPGSLVGPVRPLKIWPLSQCCLWRVWIVYSKRWLMKQFLLLPYLPQPWFPDQIVGV